MDGYSVQGSKIYRSGKLRCENSKLSSRRDQPAHGKGAHDEKRTQSHGFLALTPTNATKTIATIRRDKKSASDPLQPWNADRVVILVGQHYRRSSSYICRMVLDLVRAPVSRCGSALGVTLGVGEKAVQERKDINRAGRTTGPPTSRLWCSEVADTASPPPALGSPLC
jgi:hypothetical protein